MPQADRKTLFIVVLGFGMSLPLLWLGGALSVFSAGIGAVMAGVVCFLLHHNQVQSRRAVEAVGRERERLRVTLEKIGDAVIVTDDQCRVTFLNPVAELLTGWRQDAVGRDLAEVFHVVHEQTGAVLDNPARQILRGKEVVGLPSQTVLVGRDGVRRLIDDGAATVHVEQGKIGVILVFRDATGLKRAKEDIARLNAEAERQRLVYETVLSNTADFIYIFDLDGRFLYANQALLALWRKELSEAVGRNFFDLGYPHDLADKLQRQIQQVIETRQPVRDDTPYTSAIGTRGYEYIFVPVMGAEGKVEAVAGSTRDITERVELEINLRRLTAELSEADRRKDEFLATLAHELRNPLAPIRNGLQVLKMTDGLGEVVEQTREMMDRQLNQMVRLVDDLLDLSRVTRNKLELRKERVELSQVIASAVETSRPLIEAHGHTLHVAAPPEPIYLDADLTRLAQVFSNLLNNAAKYTEQGGQVWLSGRLEADHIVVSVKDTGIGIQPEMLPRVFEMFTQVDRTLERAEGGLGIGLTLVKRLVVMHGGEVEAHSAGYGHGSEFLVRLPVAPAPQLRNADAKSSAPDRAQPRRILVVDDNQDAAISLGMFLKLMGNEVQTVHDGLAAVQGADSFQPDVILLDIGLPKLNGYEACRRIREQPDGQRFVIVALTGWGQDEDRRRSSEAGFNFHLTKPVDPAAIEKLLGELKSPPAKL